MPSFTQLTTALALYSAAAATPVQPQKRGEFSIQQVERSQYLKIGAEQVAKTYRKFGRAVPQHILDAIDNYHSHFEAASVLDAPGTAPAVPSNQYDISYLTPVTIGGREMHLILDTGSADLWVFSDLQMPASTLAGHDYYTVDPEKEESGWDWEISYGDGSGASGRVYGDKVVVGGVTATTMAVEAAETVSTQFIRDTDCDGILGLAMSSINTILPEPQPTFFDNVVHQLAHPLFAVSLKYHAAGTYDFGFIDSSKYTGIIDYVNAKTRDGFWAIAGSHYSVGDHTTKGTVNGIVDTGTSLIYLKRNIAEAYYARVKGSVVNDAFGGYIFPCSSHLPDFSITFGGVKQTVPGKYINYAPITRGSSTCFGGIQSNADLDIPYSIFGDIFLKGKYVVFKDGTPAQIGFAQQPDV